MVNDLEKIDILCEKGDEHYINGRNNLAIECYEESIRIEPTVYAIGAKAMALYKFGKFEDAIEFFDKEIKINSENTEDTQINDSTSYERKGKSLDKLGRHQEAIECYETSIKIHPNFNDSIFFKALALDKLDRHQEAIECYEKNLETRDVLIDMEPDVFRSYQYKGNTLDKLGRHQEAIECYETFIHFCEMGLYENPEDMVFLIQKCMALNELEKFDEVIKTCTRILTLNQNHFWVLKLKSKALDKLGRHQEAIECYEKAKKTNYENDRDSNWEQERQKHYDTVENTRLRIIEQNHVKELGIYSILPKEMISVVSSNLRTIGYDSRLQILYVEFINSGMYSYYDVPIDIFENLSNATSKGKYFYNKIKNKFEYNEIEYWQLE
jgi:tetratricopeptide (TPR) repeat protein